jgi:hypothetical protein
MITDVGEYIVGAYLKIIKNCDFIVYNERFPGGGIKGLNELDVVGIDHKLNRVYLCEVTTHIRGVLYKDNETTVKKIIQKYELQQEYAGQVLTDFKNKHFMFWSPVVPKGYVTEQLVEIDGLEAVINEKYTEAIAELWEVASKTTHQSGNPFFRILQILTHLRGDKFKL